MTYFNSIYLFSLLFLFVNGHDVIDSRLANHHNTKYIEQNNQKNDQTVKIGLLIPDKQALAAKHGAELAIRKANNQEGYSGIPFQLIVRSTAGPWGTSSKKSVSLVFDDEVLVIMGSLDGGNAHLAEQVATKSKLVFLSTWATEMTLSQAFVPWYFRCLPNDKQQAISLINEVYFRRNIKKVALIGTDKSDSENAVKTFNTTARSMNIPMPEQYLFDMSEQSFREIYLSIKNKDFKAILLFGNHSFVLEIIPLFRKYNMTQPVFGSLSVMDDQKAKSPDWSILENVILVSSNHWFTENGVAFQKEFRKVYGYQPGPAAAYAFDGMNLIVEAVRNAKPDGNSILDDRDNIIDAFSEMNYKNGVTGEIKFDENGNRPGKANLMLIKNGKPLLLTND